MVTQEVSLLGRCYENERATAAVHGVQADKSIRAISGDPVSTGLVNSPDSTQRGVLVFTRGEPEQRFVSRTLPINESRPSPIIFSAPAWKRASRVRRGVSSALSPRRYPLRHSFAGRPASWFLRTGVLHLAHPPVLSGDSG